MNDDDYDPYALPTPKTLYKKLEYAMDESHPKIGKFLNRFAWWGWRKWQWGLKNLIWNVKCPDCGKRMEVWVDGDLFMCKKCIDMYHIRGSDTDPTIPDLKLDEPTRYS